MQIVIDISEKDYKNCIEYDALTSGIRKAIQKGTLLPKGHGRLIDVNEITAFRELECNGHDIDNLNEFTTIIEAERK